MPGPEQVLTVKEIDGSPSVAGVNTIQVSNGSLTDNGGGNVTLTTSGGAGTVTTTGTMTSGAIVASNGTTVIKTPSATATLDASGNISSPGSASFGVGGSVAGTVELTQGTAPSLGTTSVKVYAPASVTSYAFKLPAASATGVLLGTDATNVNTLSFVAPGSSGNVLTSNGTTWTSAAASGGITNSAGNNVIPKSDGTNLVASNLSDNGSTITLAKDVSVNNAGNSFVQFQGPGGFIYGDGTKFSVGSSLVFNLEINGANRLIINPSGNVFMGYLNTDATKTDTTLCLDTTSKEVYTGTGAAGICLGTSSARFKEQISGIKEGLAEVLQLIPRNFRYKEGIVDSGERLQYGFVAEEVESVAPNIVAKGPNGELNSVDYGAAFVLYAKAIQELYEKFDAKIELLNDRLNALCQT